ncbi:hypothetical protein Tcan_02047 [Toxocara canis]|uniref:Uncharacterized protein n=1 Tax=Toxocara canis TaxID=6265 RepID=A0A0B2UR37_TOXCA|nr:hypothetical protein Tcan_02047 [Toxocara canis]
MMSRKSELHLSHLEEEGWKEKKADALFTLAEWYMADTNYKEAINVINLSIDLFTDQYDRRIAAAYYELARAYQSDGQSSKAVEAQKKMTEVLSGRLGKLYLSLLDQSLLVTF